MHTINNFQLKKRNTFGIHVVAKEFVEYDTVEDLRQIIKNGIPKKHLHIGGGSNLLFLNDFYDGLILHSNIKSLEIIEENDLSATVKAGSGVKWDDFVAFCIKNDLYGAENLSYIPGEVGASPVQNVGAYGVEAKDIIDSVEVADVETAQLKVIPGSECGFGYRASNFKTVWKSKFFVHHVIFKLSKTKMFSLEYGHIMDALEDKENITLNSVRNAIVNIRKNKLPEPEEIGSAGSFFKNPIVDQSVFNELLRKYPEMPHFMAGEQNVKIPAAWLIEQCGWKGKNYKNAGVYSKQSLILINHGGATGQDIAELATLIIDDVMHKFGIKLSPEVCFIE